MNDFEARMQEREIEREGERKRDFFFFFFGYVHDISLFFKLYFIFSSFLLCTRYYGMYIGSVVEP